MTWLVRLLGGWLPIGTKPLGEWAGKLIWAVGIATVCIAAYHFITRETNKTSNTAEKMQNYNINSQHRFGCATFRVTPVKDK